MFLFGGTRMAGRVYENGQTCVETKVAHFFFLPVLPLGCYVISHRDGGAATEIPMNETSLGAAFLRSWGALAFASMGALVATGVAASGTVLVGGLGALMCGAGWWLGRVTPEKLREVAIYKRATGLAVDPSLLVSERKKIAARLMTTLEDAEVRFVNDASSYRHGGRVSDWRERAKDPALRDRAYLEKAYTLARIEESMAESRSERATWSALRAELWARLRAPR